MVIKSIHRRIHRYISKKLIQNGTISFKRHIFIFGDPRSGSTWLAENICKLTKGILIDEPLNLHTISYLKDQNLSWRQEIPPNVHWPEIKEYFNDLFILKRQEFNKLLHYNGISTLAKSQLGVYKIIRGKMLLPWFLKNFSQELMPIVLIRNPYSVISSQIKHPSWQFDYVRHKTPIGPYNLIYKRHDSFLKSIDSKIKMLAAQWCISNQYLLENKNSWRPYCHFITYESLLDPANQDFKKILKSYSIPIEEKLVSQINSPSITVSDDLSSDPKIQSEKWKYSLSSEQIDEIRFVLDYFEIGAYQNFVDSLN